MKCKLNIAAALYAKLRYDVKSRGAQHLIFLIHKGLRRCDNYRVSGMNSYGVKVFHITYGNAVALAVTHYLILYLFPAGNTFLDKDLVYARQAKPV